MENKESAVGAARQIREEIDITKSKMSKCGPMDDYRLINLKQYARGLLMALHLVEKNMGLPSTTPYGSKHDPDEKKPFATNRR